MKKRFFNLAVAMSVIASSLVYSSCSKDEDEDGEDPKQEQNENQDEKKEEIKDDEEKKDDENQNENQGVTSFTAVAGDSYIITNSNMPTVSTTILIDEVEGTTVTIIVSGLGSVTIGSANEDASYAVVTTSNGMGIEAKSFNEAKELAANVLFICKANSVIASGTEATSPEIKSHAGKTTFVKQ